MIMKHLFVLSICVFSSIQVSLGHCQIPAEFMMI